MELSFIRVNISVFHDLQKENPAEMSVYSAVLQVVLYQDSLAVRSSDRN